MPKPKPIVSRESAREPSRGQCPRCRAALFCALVYTDGRGYLLLWRCSSGACDYRRVL